MRYLRNLLKSKIDKLKGEYLVFWEDNNVTDKDIVSGVAEKLNDFSSGDLKNNLKGLLSASGLNAAMFGRVVTSDILARGDAAIQVAHSFTTHDDESEVNSFTVFD